jgi:hypothetical protein
MNHMFDRGHRCMAGAVCTAAVLLGTILFAGGCASQSKPGSAADAVDAATPQPSPNETVTPVQGQGSPAVPRDAEVKPDQMEASAGTPNALARKAQTWSREMETLLSRRPAPTQQTPTSLEPSEVKWADPSDFRLGDVTSTSGAARTAQPLVRPVIETSPSQANQLASIPPAPEQNVVTANASANAPAREEEPATRPSTSAASPPVKGGAPMPMSMSSVGLSEKLATRVREYPRDVSAHLEYQLLQFLLDEQVPQLAALAALPNEDRELVTAVLDGLSLFRSTLRSDNNMLLSKKIRPLIDMADRLRSQADLTIPAVALCKSVEGFAKYQPIEPARFSAGAEHKAIVYCEVANFMSNLNEQHQWETRLRQELVLYTEGGVPVWNDRTETIVDTARNRRHDFFINKRIVIPGNLTVGRYLLKVSIIDEQANRVAEQTVPLVIMAK